MRLWRSQRLLDGCCTFDSSFFEALRRKLSANITWVPGLAPAGDGSWKNFKEWTLGDPQDKRWEGGGPAAQCRVTLSGVWTWRDVTVFVSRARLRRCSCWRVKAVAGLWLWKLSLWPVMCHGAVWCSRKLRLLSWMTLIIFFNSKQVVCVPKTKTRWKLVKAKWENALTTDSSSSFQVQSQVFVPQWPF